MSMFAELLELVVHAGQLPLDVLGRVRNLFLDPRDVEEHAAVRAAAAAFTSRLMQRATWSRVSSSGGRRAFLSPCV